MPKRTAMIAVGLWCARMLLASGPAAAGALDRVAADLDGEPILLSEVFIRARPALLASQPPATGAGQALTAIHQAILRDALETCIQDHLVRHEADRLRVAVSAAQIDQALDEVARTNGLSRDKLLEEARKQGLEPAAYRTEVERQLLRMKLFSLQMRSQPTDPAPQAPEARALQLEQRQRAWLAELEQAASVERLMAATEVPNRPAADSSPSGQAPQACSEPLPPPAFVWLPDRLPAALIASQQIYRNRLGVAVGQIFSRSQLVQGLDNLRKLHTAYGRSQLVVEPVTSIDSTAHTIDLILEIRDPDKRPTPAP